MKELNEILKCIVSDVDSSQCLERFFFNISIPEVLDSAAFKALLVEEKLSFYSHWFEQENFSCLLSNESKSNIRHFAEAISEICTVPQFPSLEYSNLHDVDFKDSIRNSITSLKLLIKLFSMKNINFGAKLETFEPLLNVTLIVCFEHNTEQLWSCTESVKLSKQLQTIIASSTIDLHSYLIKESSSSKHDYIYEELLVSMKERLSKTKWKLSPSYASVFCVLLFQLKSDLNLEYLLPLPLLMLCDFEMHYKLLGFKCLHHILTHGSRSHIRMHDRVLVILDALLKQFHNQEQEVAEELFKCLPQVLDIIERKTASQRLGEDTKTDEAFTTYLQCMNFENKIALQRVYSKQLGAFVKQLSITSVKHMTAILKIIKTYMEYYDPIDEEIRINTMQALLQLMTQTWVRVPNHGLEITECLFRLLHAISHHNYGGSEEARGSLLLLIKQSFDLLHRLCPKHLSECFKGVMAIKTYSNTFQNNVQSIAQILEIK